MRKQNKKFMGKSATTDVLSFPQITPGKVNKPDLKRYQNQSLGDILISLDQAKKQASEQGISMRKEVLFLIVHSVLHLIGYDHDGIKHEQEMQEAEARLWQRLLKQGI